MSRRFLMETAVFCCPDPCAPPQPESTEAVLANKETDEHNNPKHHDKEDNPLHPGAKRAVVCGEDQNQTCP